jgi:hypothetical protein
LIGTNTPQAVGIVRQPHQDALALFDAERAQRVRRADRVHLHLAIGPSLAVGENGEDLFGLLARPSLDHVPLDTLIRPRHARVQMIVHGHSSRLRSGAFGQL